jgi:hypothetical protein
MSDAAKAELDRAAPPYQYPNLDAWLHQIRILRTQLNDCR